MANPDPAGKPGYAANLKSNLAKRVGVLQAHDAMWQAPDANPDVKTYRQAVEDAAEQLLGQEECLEGFVAERDRLEASMRAVESLYSRGEAPGSEFSAAMAAWEQACADVDAGTAGCQCAQTELAQKQLHLRWAEVAAGAIVRRAKLERQIANDLRTITLQMAGDLPSEHPISLRHAARAPFLAPVIAARRNITRYLPESERAAWDAETDSLES